MPDLSNDKLKFALSNLEINSNYKLTLSLVKWLLIAIPKEEWMNIDERNHLENVLYNSLNSNSDDIVLPHAKVEGSLRQDKRLIDLLEMRLQQETNVIRIFTDYDYAKEILPNINNICVLVDDINDSDFLLTPKHITNFYSLPMHLRVNQFPYEGGFVRKDLLPLTIRGYCYKENYAPSWWLSCYDLTTEYHLFSYEIEQRNKRKHSNHWIIKPAQGTRAIGHHILLEHENTDLMLFEAGMFAYSSILDLHHLSQEKYPEFSTIQKKYSNVQSCDRVAQLLIHDPLLVRKLKFDLRTFVFVRSFVPFEAYLHQHHYARLANIEYNIEDLSNNEVVLTVNAYNDDEKIANKQSRIFRRDLKIELLKENSELKYYDMMFSMVSMFSELFQGISHSVGNWPNSSAYYAIDVMFDQSMDKNIPIAKLIEINFMGDWEASRLGSAYEEEYYEWVGDLINCLASKCPVNSDRLIPLGLSSDELKQYTQKVF